MELREHAKQGPRSSYYNSEFSVALKHFGQVEGPLTDCGVPVPPPDVELSPDLGLALVKLADNESAAARINPTWQNELRALDRPDGRPDLRSVHDNAFRIFILMASCRFNSDRFYTGDYNPDNYTEVGVRWINDTTMAGALLRHWPQLAAKLPEKANAFQPWRATKVKKAQS